MSKPCTTLYVVRHGETSWNRAGRVQGHTDIALSAEGQSQVRHLATQLRGHTFAAMYSSDLQRAQETALLLKPQVAGPLCLDERLRERHFGSFQGLTWAEIAEQQPHAFQVHHSHDPDFAMPGGQSRRAHFSTVADFFGQMEQAHTGESVLLVAHGGTIECMLYHVLGIDLRQALPFSCLNSVSNVFEHELGRWVLRRWTSVRL